MEKQKKADVYANLGEELDAIEEQAKAMSLDKLVAAFKDAAGNGRKDLTEEQKMRLATLCLNSGKGHSLVRSRAVEIMRPMMVMDHISSCVIACFCRQEFPSPNKKFLLDLKREYPEKYDTYLRDLSRIINGSPGTSAPDFLPKVDAGSGFEDPFGIGKWYLQEIARPFGGTDARNIIDSGTLTTLKRLFDCSISMPHGAHPAVQNHIAIMLMMLMEKSQKEKYADITKNMGKNIFTLWQNCSAALINIPVDARIKLFLLMYDWMKEDHNRAVTIFYSLFVEFFTKKNGQNENILALIATYFNILQTNRTFFTAFMEHDVHILNKFIELAREGSPLESAFAAMVLADYCKKDPVLFAERVRVVTKEVFDKIKWDKGTTGKMIALTLKMPRDEKGLIVDAIELRARFSAGESEIAESHQKTIDGVAVIVSNTGGKAKEAAKLKYEKPEIKFVEEVDPKKDFARALVLRTAYTSKSRGLVPLILMQRKKA